MRTHHASTQPTKSENPPIGVESLRHQGTHVSCIRCKSRKTQTIVAVAGATVHMHVGREPFFCPGGGGGSVSPCWRPPTTLRGPRDSIVGVMAPRALEEISHTSLMA